MDVFKEMASGYSNGNGLEVDSRVSAALAPFKVNRTYSLTAQSSDLGPTSNKITINPNDYQIISAWISTAAVTGSLTTIDVITPTEFGARMRNTITYPSSTYPILVPLYDDFLSMAKVAYLIPMFLPSTAMKTLSLKKPAIPRLDITYVNGVETQAGTSVALEWDSTFHNDIIRKALQYLGISVGNDLIVQAVALQENKEK